MIMVIELSLIIISIILKMKAERGEDIELILKAKKENNSGILSNERLLMIKAGIISYFSEAPKKFIASSKFLQTSGQFPKFTIKANDIDHMDLKGGVLTMLFKKTKLITKNQFQDMVKKKGYQPDRASEISANEESGGFVKWNFECDDQEQLNEFYRYTNLFRANNPNFVPSLSAVIATFRGQKKPPQPRQMSMKPATNQKNELEKQRLSQVAPMSDGNDLFLNAKDKKVETKEQPKQQPKQQPQPQNIEIQPQIESQNERIDKLKSRIENMYTPSDQIDEKMSQDKLSELSKQPIEPKIQENIPIQEKSLIHQLQESSIAPQIEQVKEPQTKQQVVQPKQEQPTIAQKPIEPIQPTQIEKDSAFSKSKKVRIAQTPFLNHSYDIQSNNTEQQSSKKKRRKLHQFLKATTYIDNFDPKQVCKNLSISLQQLQQLMKAHSRDEQSPWTYIENNLAYQLNKGKNKLTKRLKMNDEVIKEYYQLGEVNQDNYDFLKIPLEGQISYIAAQSPNQEEVEALQWMEEQIKNTSPKAFSTKIINKTHFKIYIRQIEFKRQNIKHLKGGWIVNRHGHLQQFLAYLRLQKIIKDLNSTNDLDITLAETIYLRYKQFQGIGKEWRVGYSSLPIKSIKSLEYITRSKEMLNFYRDFPQFNIITQIIKQGHKYRIHLDRIPQAIQSKRDHAVLLQELKKLIFPFDNELDLFYQNQHYTAIQNYCLQEIQEVLYRKKTIDKDDLNAIIKTMKNNISVDTLCKLIGCRIDKKGNIHFYHNILRLGGRQFGEQISLIKRWKKKGNIEMGRQLSKRLMGKLHEYQSVTPISHFIQIYLHVIDFMIVNQGELHRALSILLKVLTHLGQSQVQQYPIYLALMKTYLKLGQMQNFIKTLQNCRLFIKEMFQQFSPLLDYSLQRIVIIVMLKQDAQKTLSYSYKLLKQIQLNTYFPGSIKEKYICKLEWDKNNILLTVDQSYKAFTDCFSKLTQIQGKSSFYPDYWIQGVLCLSRCWLSIQQTNSVNSAQLQKRIGYAIELAFSRQNLEMVFVLFQTGRKVLDRCQQLNLPMLLQSQSAFESAKIEFNQTQTQIFYILNQNN